MADNKNESVVGIKLDISNLNDILDKIKKVGNNLNLDTKALPNSNSTISKALQDLNKTMRAYGAMIYKTNSTAKKSMQQTHEYMTNLHEKLYFINNTLQNQLQYFKLKDKKEKHKANIQALRQQRQEKQKKFIEKIESNHKQQLEFENQVKELRIKQHKQHMADLKNKALNTRHLSLFGMQTYQQSLNKANLKYKKAKRNAPTLNRAQKQLIQQEQQDYQNEIASIRKQALFKPQGLKKYLSYLNIKNLLSPKDTQVKLIKNDIEHKKNLTHILLYNKRIQSSGAKTLKMINKALMPVHYTMILFNKLVNVLDKAMKKAGKKIDSVIKTTMLKVAKWGTIGIVGLAIAGIHKWIKGYADQKNQFIDLLKLSNETTIEPNKLKAMLETSKATNLPEYAQLGIGLGTMHRDHRIYKLLSTIGLNPMALYKLPLFERLRITIKALEQTYDKWNTKGLAPQLQALDSIFKESTGINSPLSALIGANKQDKKNYHLLSRADEMREKVYATLNPNNDYHKALKDLNNEMTEGTKRNLETFNRQIEQMKLITKGYEDMNMVIQQLEKQFTNLIIAIEKITSAFGIFDKSKSFINSMGNSISNFVNNNISITHNTDFTNSTMEKMFLNGSMDQQIKH